MKKFILSSVVLFSSCLLLISCEKELAEDAIYDPKYKETDAIASQAKELMNQADFIFMRNNSLVELYMQSGDEDIYKVDHFNDIPENLSATYNLIRNKEGNIMYAAEFPYSETGECENIYESLFNESGDLILFVRKSSFLSDSVVVYEKSEYYYNKRGKLLKKTYQLKYGETTEIPQGINVDFRYRLPYEKYKSRKKWLRAHGLDK